MAFDPQRTQNVASAIKALKAEKMAKRTQNVASAVKALKQMKESQYMTREDLIDAIVEGEMRRAATHVLGPHGFVGSVFAPVVGTAAGAAVSHLRTGEQLRTMDTTQGSNKDKQAAAKKFAQSHPITAKFVLPKNETARKRLANRGTAGHIAHGALRMVGGPPNVARYATKVSYARSGFHR